MMRCATLTIAALFLAALFGETAALDAAKGAPKRPAPKVHRPVHRPPPKPRPRCQLCNTGGSLQVHHRTYQRRGYERLDDLTVLCRKCHERQHGIENKAANDEAIPYQTTDTIHYAADRRRSE